MNSVDGLLSLLSMNADSRRRDDVSLCGEEMVVGLFCGVKQNQPCLPRFYEQGRKVPGDGENVEAAVAGRELFGVADATKRAINEDPKPVA